MGGGGEFQLVIVQRTVLNFVHVHWDFTCFAATTDFVANYVDFFKNAILRGLPDLLQYYMGGGWSAETPKLYYVIYEQPLIRHLPPAPIFHGDQ